MRTWLTLGSALLFLPSLAGAQPHGDDEPVVPPIAPLTITLVEGAADLARDSGVMPAQAPDLLGEGDRLLTSGGRVELVYADGSAVHVDRETDLRVDTPGRLRLVRGHVIVRTSAAVEHLDVATPAGLVRLAARGEYDLSASDLEDDTIVGTIRGEATVHVAGSDLRVTPDDVLHVHPRDPRPRWTRAYTLRSPLGDWAAARMYESTTALRGQPLPPALAPYAPVFAHHGHWSTLAPYGPVWTPTVAADWRPYANGAWRQTRYGWTWIDDDAWGSPVHHYGRWGRWTNGRWFWIPQATWGPAWVAWAVGADHIGWSPMGWDARPVVDFFAGARLGPIDLWASTWSVVPRHTFGRGLVTPHLQDLRYLPGPVLGGFVVQSRPPRSSDRGALALSQPWNRGVDSARPRANGAPDRGVRQRPTPNDPPPGTGERPRVTESPAGRVDDSTPPAPWRAPLAVDRERSGRPYQPPPGTAPYDPVSPNGGRGPGARDGSRARPRPVEQQPPPSHPVQSGASPGTSRRTTPDGPPPSGASGEPRSRRAPGAGGGAEGRPGAPEGGARRRPR